MLNQSKCTPPDCIYTLPEVNDLADQPIFKIRGVRSMAMVTYRLLLGRLGWLLVFLQESAKPFVALDGGIRARLHFRKK